MFIQESGSIEKPSILLLHGNGSNWTMWKTHMEYLTEYHCVAPDFPGYGRSNHEEWVSLDATADRLIDIIRSRTAHRRAHIVGLSLGGSTALTLLRKAPDVIDHAIVDGAGVLPLPGFAFQKVGLHLLRPFLHTNFVIKTLARMMKIPDEGYAEFKQGMLAMSPASFTRSFLQALSQRQPPGLEKVNCPVLLVAGEKEPEAVRQSNALLAKVLPNAECRLAPGVGHGWMAEKPELHIRMVQAWLADEPLPRELA